MSKEEDMKFIKKFIDISIIDICKKLDVDKANLYSNKASANSTHKVAIELRKRLDEFTNKVEKESIVLYKEFENGAKVYEITYKIDNKQITTYQGFDKNGLPLYSTNGFVDGKINKSELKEFLDFIKHNE